MMQQVRFVVQKRNGLNTSVNSELLSCECTGLEALMRVKLKQWGYSAVFWFSTKTQK